MATKKQTWDSGALKRQVDAIHAKYKPIVRRFYVAEYTPAYEDDCKWYPDQTRRVSPYFDTKESAEAWQDDYDPAAGTKFVIYVETLCEHTERTWMAGDWLG